MLKLKLIIYLVFISLSLISCSNNLSDAEKDISDAPVFFETEGSVDYLADFRVNNDRTSSEFDYFFGSNEHKNDYDISYTSVWLNQKNFSNSKISKQAFVRLYLGNLYLAEGQFAFTNYEEFFDKITKERDLGFNKDMITAEFFYIENDVSSSRTEIIRNEYYVSESGFINITRQEEGELLVKFDIQLAFVENANNLSDIEHAILKKDRLNVTGQFVTGTISTDE